MKRIELEEAKMWLKRLPAGTIVDTWSGQAPRQISITAFHVVQRRSHNNAREALAVRVRVFGQQSGPPEFVMAQILTSNRDILAAIPFSEMDWALPAERKLRVKDLLAQLDAVTVLAGC